MAIPTLTLPAKVNIDFGSTADTTTKVLQADFGDGYSQRSGDGINSVLIKVSWTIKNLKAAENAILVNQFAGLKGYMPFKFTLPWQSSPLVFICPQWQENFVNYLIVSLSGTWQQVFDVG